MKLGQLVSGADQAFADRTVTGFAIDHRKIAPGTVFGAFEGASFNGEDFIDAAIAAGAVAIVARPEAKVVGAVHIADAEPRRAFARLAAAYFRPFPGQIAAVPAQMARHQPLSSPASFGAWRGIMPRR